MQCLGVQEHRERSVPIDGCRGRCNDEGMYLETQVDIVDSIRGRDVFIIQTGYTSSDSMSISDSIMELLIMCYACKTSSARKVIGERGIPY